MQERLDCVTINLLPVQAGFHAFLSSGKSINKVRCFFWEGGGLVKKKINGRFVQWDMGILIFKWFCEKLVIDYQRICLVGKGNNWLQIILWKMVLKKSYWNVYREFDVIFLLKITEVLVVIGLFPVQFTCRSVVNWNGKG